MDAIGTAVLIGFAVLAAIAVLPVLVVILGWLVFAAGAIEVLATSGDQGGETVLLGAALIGFGVWLRHGGPARLAAALWRLVRRLRDSRRARTYDPGPTPVAPEPTGGLPFARARDVAHGGRRHRMP